jgi:protease-4
MKRSGFWMSLLMVLAVLTAMGLVGGQGWKADGLKLSLSGAVRDKIAVVPVYGELVSPEFVVQLLHRYRDEVKGLKAVVLAIDSPGGGVAAAQEIVEAVQDLQDHGIYVVAAMGSMAASGGYYIAAPCDRIVANPGTLTGSIGVIMQTVDAKKILDKVGLDFEVVKSGEFKDAGSISRPLTAKERALFQGVINDVYGQFLDVVAEERKAPIRAVLAKRKHVPEQGVSDADIRNFVKSYADGRVFSGRMALEYGLVDELGGLDKAVHSAAELAGLQNPDVVTYKEGKTFAELLTGISKADIRSWASAALGASTHKFGFYAW